MAIADLLWACPVCGLDRGLRGLRGAEPGTCSGCGARFERTRGASIRARLRGGEERVRAPAAWVDDLPDAAALLEAADPVRSAAVTARFVDRFEPVRAGARYLNRIEIFGPEQGGRLTLRPDRLTYAAGHGTPSAAEPLTWQFSELRAVQASSRSLQIRGGSHPLGSFAFVDDSSFLWEQLLALAVGAFYRGSGRGEIIEMQPRIVTR